MQRQLHKMLFLALLAIVALTPLGISTPASAQGPRCFNETPYCIQPGPILDYWERNGGLAVFGLPIGDLQTETLPAPTQGNPNATWTGPVQWFERDRLEDHSADGQGVLAGRLGASLLELQGRPWETFAKVTSAAAGCRFFEQTGHSLCEPFLSYWTNNGGLPRFGYPITEPVEETLDASGGNTWTGKVQYFERRRMEQHPENANTAYEVLLGLLGNEIRTYQPSPSCTRTVLPELRRAYDRILYFRDQMGCPQETYQDILAATQNFENGLMVWSELTKTNRRIWAYLSYGSYEIYSDTWTEADGDTPAGMSAPEGKYLPRRGFGKVWRDDPGLRSRIGYAIEQYEQARTATVQRFDNGWMVWIKETDIVYVFGPQDWKPAQLVSRQG